jgi:hypothetical protein
VLVGSVVPEVEAPDGSVLFELVGAGGVCLVLVPEVDGVGDECGEFEEDEPLEFVSAGGAGAGGGTGGTGGAGGVGT